MAEQRKFKNVFQKLLVIQQRINGLGKDKTTYSYKYVTGDKVLGEIKPMMNELGLILKQEIVSIDNVRQDYSTKSGAKSEINSKVMMKFTWVDTETGEKDENLFGANGQNDWDKGVGSALTYGERYFLLKYFHIATDEDDIDNPERKPQEPTAPKQQPAKPAPAKENPQPEPELKVVPSASAEQKEEIQRLLQNDCFTKKEKADIALSLAKLTRDRAIKALNWAREQIEERTGKPAGMMPLKAKDPASVPQREFIGKLINSHVFSEGEKEEAAMKCESNHFTVSEAAEYITQLEQLIKERKAAEKAEREAA